MADTLTIRGGKLMLATDEGRQIELPEEQLVDMLRSEIEAPINGAALPDGIKFMQWRAPFLMVVHQFSAHVRRLRWIADDSPVPYGPGTKFDIRRISLPYAITFATFFQRGNQLSIMGANELYFRNEPLKFKTDRVCYPALLNVSRIEAPKRLRSWICTQYLRCEPNQDWTAQLGALLDHTFNGGFNRSSEHHEGASWYGESQGIHPDLHPIARWEQASHDNDAFALSVPWKPCPLNVGELMDAMLDECAKSMAGHTGRLSASKKPAGLVARFMNFAHKAVNGK